ncbi:MAG: N-acetylglucosamine-6-phosphate deacetylase [Elusimicrobiota bacterium]|jgi:N-acetylglucosamine-6-phosphate deacetylase|nr:N-acetylglucosamine-6-phosphate deacetylase [Elusimicrobiota bacterium]
MKTLFYNGKIISGGTIIEGGLLVENGIIGEIFDSPALIAAALDASDKKIDLKRNYLAPGFIDTHIHGCGGFGTDTKNPQDLLAMSEILLKQGVIAFAPTIYPANIDDMAALLKRFSSIIGAEKGAEILGFHLEGPFISPEKLGVMKPQDIRPVNMEDAQKLYSAANGKIFSMTAAPELENIDKLAAFAKEHNFILQAGHTNATYEQAEYGASLGITHATHLFNAMSGLNHRAPGTAGAVLTDDRFSAEIIADGVHLAPAIVKMILMLKGPSNVILVSDSINPAGTAKGIANGEEVVLSGGVFKRKVDNVIAGSAASMLQSVKNLVKWGYPLEYASMAASDNPARLHNLNVGSIQKGKNARLIILDKELNLLETII